MMRKYKMVAILPVLLLVAMQFNVAGASVEETNESIAIEIGNANEDGTQTTETYEVSEAELSELETILAALVSSVESASSIEEILKIISGFQFGKGKIGQIITRIITIITNLIKRTMNRIFSIFDISLVISCGKGFKFNPLRHTELFRLRKGFAFWHYSNSKFLDKTIIFNLKGLKTKILSDSQIGWMKNFFGLYIYIAKSFPQKSFTFFMGTADRINGIARKTMLSHP